MSTAEAGLIIQIIDEPLKEGVDLVERAAEYSQRLRDIRALASAPSKGTVEAEREACAKEAERVFMRTPTEIAAAIRARTT